MPTSISKKKIGTTYDVLLAKYGGRLFLASSKELQRVKEKGIGEVIAAMQRFHTK